MRGFSKLLILLFIFASTLFAGAADDSNYITDFGIFVYGDVQAIQNAFILVQAIAASDVMPWILTLIATFYLPYSAWEYSQSGNGKKLAANIVFMTASFLTLDTAHISTTIHIEDLRAETNTAGLPEKTYAVVDGIPYPISLVTSTISTVVDSIQKEYIDAIQLINVDNGLDINGASYNNVGFMNTLGDILKVSKMASFDKDENLSLFGRATQAYINDCALKSAVYTNPDKIVALKNPSEDLFKAMRPDELGITGDAYKITFENEDEMQCDDFYDTYIGDKYDETAIKLLEYMDKMTVGNLSSSDVINAMKSMGARIDDSFIADDVGKFKAYIMNVAATVPLNNAFRNYTLDITSGQDVANAITAGATTAELQAEGAGRFKWMAEVLPMGFHYMLGIIYAISILIMLVATAVGASKGMMIWKNFTKGLITFEFIKIALVIVNSSVNQYAAVHAADFLASVGQNPASVASLPGYMNYVATMTGIAGILGISAIFMIPAMVFSGEVAMAAGAIGALVGRYKGQDIKTATDASAQQKATEEAWENELRDKALLDNMGISVPAGMGASEYYAEYKKSAESANVGFGAMRAGTSQIDKAAHVVKGQTIQNITAGATLNDSGVTMNDFVKAGIGQGSMMANDLGHKIDYGERVSASEALEYGKLSGAAQAEADRSTYEGAILGGKENYISGVGKQALKKAASTAEYGKNTSLKSARDAGRFEGIMGAAKDTTISNDDNLEGDATTLGADSAYKTIKSAKGLQKAKVFNEDGSIDKTSRDKVTGQLESDKYMQGLENQARMTANSIQGLGRLHELTEQDMTNIQRNAQADALSKFEKGRVLKEKYGANLDEEKEVKDKKGKKVATLNGYRDAAYQNASLQEDKAIGTAAGYKNGQVNPQMVQQNAAYGLISQNVATDSRLAKLGGIDKAVHQDSVDSSMKAAVQRSTLNEQLKKGGATQGLNDSAEKLAKAIDDVAKTIGRKAGAGLGADMTVQEKADKNYKGGYDKLQKDLASGKVMSDIGTIDGSKTRGGFDKASYKAGVEKGAGMGAAYDNMAKLTGSDDKGKIAQALHNRTSMTDTKRHLIEDIGVFGLDRYNKVMGTNYSGEAANALSLAGAGLLTAEAFQALRGQKGPIRYLGGKVIDGAGKLKDKINNKLYPNQMSESSNPAGSSTNNETPHGTDNHNNGQDLHKSNESHKSPPKYISDGYGGVKPNPAYQEHIVSKKAENLKRNTKTTAGLFALGFVDDFMDGLGIDYKNNRTASAIHNVSAFTGDMFSAGFEALSGSVKGLGQLLSGHPSQAWNTVSNSISSAASHALDSYNHNLVNADSRFSAQNTIQAAQNDPGLAAAADAYNINQNRQAAQSYSPGRVMTMHSRGGNVGMYVNNKSGMLMVQPEGTAFPINTGISGQQFNSIMQNPQLASDFSSWMAQQNFMDNGGNHQSQVEQSPVIQKMDTSMQMTEMYSIRNNQLSRANMGMAEEFHNASIDYIDETISGIEEYISELNDKLDVM